MKGAPTGRLRVWTAVAVATALALSSLWVLEIMRKRTDEILPAAGRTEPDYYVDRFEFVQMGPEGAPRYTLSGKLLKHYPADDSAEVDQPIVNSLSADAPPMTVVANRARVEDDNSKVHLYGDVRLDRPATAQSAPLQMRTEYALVLPDRDIVRTDKPVTITLGESVLRGVGMIANNATREFELLSSVRGKYVAPPQ